MTVIKIGQPAASAWQHLADDEQPGGGPFTVSLTRWLESGKTLSASGLHVGVRLAAADDPEALANDLATLSLIVLDMAAFTDGRPFSQARLLRDRYGYTGELRARGDFLRDQMFFLSRVGVDVFEFPEGTDLQDRLKAFDEFSVTYQAASDTPEPLYRRR
ncbi:MAG: DUF934 domain-containing protein [Methylococcus sp.]|nr:MAG: DUF934 domain-containing protein [Methylococcus sp.]